METTNSLLVNLSQDEMLDCQAGFCGWVDMLWSGCKVGLAVGGAAGIAYYFT